MPNDFAHVPLRHANAEQTVVRLKTALDAIGSLRLARDGRLGVRTTAAGPFQLGHALAVDGVAGSRAPVILDSLVTSVTPGPLALADVRQMFPDTPEAPIARNLPAIIAALNGAGLAEPRMLLVALATIRAEAETFEPAEEAISDWNTSPGGHPFDLYDHRPGLGNRGAPDGATFRGRGYVQLTGRRTYALFSTHPGDASLDATPARACTPHVAAQLLAACLKARRAPIAAALLSDDLARARRLVNGGDHGLARFTDTYRRGERILGFA